MSIKIVIKDKNLTVKEHKVVERYYECVIDYGDWIFIEESQKNVKFETENEDLLLLFSSDDTIVLKSLVKCLKENPNENIPAQFSDMGLINQLSTKLEFVKNDLFDEEYFIKDIDKLNSLLNGKSQEKVTASVLNKSVKFQYEKQETLEVENETFEVYKEGDFIIYLRT
ncbi:MAG: hypothetical protein WCY75_03550 [Sulfurimonadaceae bacterium]